MKKEMTFMIATMFAIVFFVGLASATLSISTINNLDQNGGSFEFNVSSTLNESVQLSLSDVVSGDSTISFVLSDSTVVLDDSNSRVKTITVSYTVPSDFNFMLGETYSTVLSLNATNSSTLTKTIYFEKTSFCEFGEKGDLEIAEINIDNEGLGSDDEWEPLDTIKIEVNVENTNRDDTISNVEAEIMILNEEGEDVTDDFFVSNNDKILDFGRIKDDSDETQIAELRVDPKIDEGKYRIFIKAYKDNHEEDECTEESRDFSKDTYEEIEVSIGDRIVGIDDLEYEKKVACGTTNTVSFDFYNFDLADREEDMRVNLYSSNLNIDLFSDKFDLRKGKSETLTFEYTVPKDAEEKKYTFKILYDYDYDKNKDRYSEKEQEAETFSVIVEGNCYVDLTPTISASLISEKAIEGETVEIKVTVLNDDSDAQFSVAPQGYEEFADLVEISPQTEEIAVGESRDFVLKFKLKGDSEGDRQFDVVTTSQGRVVSTQKVLVSVEDRTFNVDLDKYFRNLDWATVGIILLNLILIIAIIIVARKVLKRK